MAADRNAVKRQGEVPRFFVMIRQTATGYCADVPDLPGCVAVAKTVKAARRLIAEAIALHLELMHESGEKIPAPRQSIRFMPDESSNEEFCTWVEVKTPFLLKRKHS